MNSQPVDQAWPEPTVIDALRLLSGHCDGARSLDGAGFNRFDSDFGRSLAARDSLSPKQESSALKMLRKYRRQLAIGGIDYDKLADRTNQARHTNSDAQDRPKRVVVLSGTRFVFRYPWDPVITAAIGKLPDRRFHDHDHPWHGEYKVWSMPLDRSLEVEELAQKFSFRVAPDAQAYIDQNRAAAQAEKDRVEALIAASKAEDSDIELKVQGLRPFQKAGVQYALDRRQTFIADEMGLGKTVQALATIEEDDAFPVVVVAPKSVIRTWRREARKWLPHRTWQIADTKSHIKQNVDITLIHYDVVEKRKEALAGKIIGFREVGKGKHKRQKPVREPSWVRAFIGDESHMIKNRNAKRTMAIEEITESLGEEDPIILLLSGTPLVNRPAELITQLTILRRLNDFGGFMRFWKRYCGGSQGGAQNLNELNTELRMHCFPYDTLVETEHGPLAIGEIVERKLKVRVWSRASDGRIELQPAVDFSTRAADEPLVRIRYGSDNFVDCTADHRIWTTEGYKRADSLKRDDHLLVLSQTRYPEMERGATNTVEVLRTEMRWSGTISKPTGNQQNDVHTSGQQRSGHLQILRMVQGTHAVEKHPIGTETTLLRSIVCEQLEANTSPCRRHFGQDDSRSQVVCEARGMGQSVEGYSSFCTTCRSNQSWRTSSICQEVQDDSVRSNHEACSHVACSLGLARGMARVSGSTGTCHRTLSSGRPAFCLGRHCPSLITSGYRGRRSIPSFEAATGTRPMEDQGTRFTQVDGVEVLEPGSRNSTGTDNHDGLVYDIEVAGNHNFFAGGILVHNCMVRRLKKDVLKELPPRQWAPVEMPISNEPEYRRAEAAFISWLQETGGNWQAALRAETITRMNALRQLAARGKLEAAIQWIRDFLENGNKLVVFAYHQPIQQAILEALGDYNPRVIKAGQSDEVREQNRIDFQEKDEIRVIVVSLMAGGQGIDLFAASNVAFIELAWTPKDMFQAIDRCHRIGQQSESAVMGWELVCSNTIDDDLQEILEAKFEIHEQAMDGKAAADAEEVGEGAVANAVVERMMARS